ncbi:transmembrane protein, putative (macronuclear) [Tetrahymena thermophila SB210]|uniref:Transmembrane protein, putative n=1 Tax=Tetrahymena thermophila (strain SB210) TaxID=312017 RepID=W7XIZ0_TETTS|nr:transmembrane protein, putative [Tetrahymena thermophila SB210]EWS73724.1 transmembrane protein, putative [Tetrahymena thermophila SB210]|eukprot:XP_012653762.1 transmembrane protein, putative [Tetrahymena thermophila SB210]
MEVTSVLISVLQAIIHKQKEAMLILNSAKNVLVTAFLVKIHLVALNVINFIKNIFVMVFYYAFVIVQNVKEIHQICPKISAVWQAIVLNVSSMSVFVKNAIKNILIFTQTLAYKFVQMELFQMKIISASNVILYVKVAQVNHQRVV